MKTNKILIVLGYCCLSIINQCQNQPIPEEHSDAFSRYKASLSRESDTENVDGTPISGAYIVDDDLVVHSEDDLRQYFEEFVLPAKEMAVSEDLIVNRVGSHDDVWSATQRKTITYCVSDKFKTHKTAVVESLKLAMAAWQNVADVNYTYDPQEDSKCDPKNTKVTFDVRPTSGAGYLARSFFPANPRSQRNILIDATAFKVTPPLTLTGILRHELGHTLGFRHEHTRPEAGGKCYEDASWRPLTTYDSASVMHYPQCNGTGDWGLTLTAKDKAGAAKLYGTPKR